MSSLFAHWPDFSLANGLHLIAILVIAVLINRILRSVTNLVIQPAASQARAAQNRELQTRALAGVLYGVGSKIVWSMALLTALPEFGINIFPLVVLIGLAIIAIGFGAQRLLRDLIAGFCIVIEDQFTIGELIQVNDTSGRVEHLTLRRTVVRDARGALVTVANGEIRMAGNLSRDWSQSFIDVSFAPEASVDTILEALETAAAEIRNDAAWSKTLVDGPRILGVQSFDRDATTIRIQIRTAPTRQDEVSRELRRRIQAEFQRRGIVFSQVQRMEFVPAVKSSGENASSPPAET
ncbi:MAG: mechanosensitive ion channel family protein [Candidatus Acidiferrum sp.]